MRLSHSRSRHPPNSDCSESASPGTAWWVLDGIVFVATISALLLGLSSAQAEAEEFSQLFTQPLPVGSWVVGKCARLFCATVPASALLVLPTVLSAGGSLLLLGVATAAAAISLLFSWAGLAIGLWFYDPVRGMIAALGFWCVLLFGVDLALITIGGAEWIHTHRAPWVAVLMVSPLDAFRVTLLFFVEGAAFSGSDLHPLTNWWFEHPVLWLTLCLSGWTAVAMLVAVVAARRRLCR